MTTRMRRAPWTVARSVLLTQAAAAEFHALPGPAASCLPGLLDLGSRSLEAKGGN